MILLDTHAVIWLAQSHRRVRSLQRTRALYLSPASILEIQFLAEAGRLRWKPGRSLDDLAADDRWRLDEPPAARWFSQACELGWTRDPFDRLLAAHAHLRNWKLATADDALIEHLGASRVVAL